MNTLVKGLVASAAMGFAATAAAFPVNLESVEGTWGTPTGGSNIQGVGTSEIRWGTGEKTCSGSLWWKHCENGPQSGYGFQGPADLPKAITSDDEFVLGTFTHYNNPITGEAITGVNLTSTLPSQQLVITVLSPALTPSNFCTTKPLTWGKSAFSFSAGM